MAIFAGVVRDDDNVAGLEYEAYEDMAIAEMEKIEKEACEIFGLRSAVITHRVGYVPVNDIAVLICCTGNDAVMAVKGCKYMIDELKERVPIWKKNVHL